ncbi:MAG TPA: glycoside hydrolase family 66 protein [Solirubrobacteraceae bacterium]|nr:glycoside hydrolase family 66 protein [Solirubrobacteraceae bacterium]
MTFDNERDPAPAATGSASGPGLQAPPPFDKLRAFYATGDEIGLTLNPADGRSVVARRATTEVHRAVAEGDRMRIADLPPGTYGVEVLNAEGEVMSEEFTTVGAHAGERPVHGFATSFEDDDVPALLEWHRALRTTVVQVYDWMASYTAPMPPEQRWKDPSNRPVSADALRSLAAGLGAGGAISHAYAPVYAVGNEFAAEHPELLMYQGDGQPVRFLDQIVLADPGSSEWQRHFADTYGAAADALGFGGMHLDTYGYPRVAFRANGEAIDLRLAYESFLTAVRAARPRDLLSFNQVNGVPSAARLPQGPGFRYCEVWPANDSWRHLEGLLDRSSGTAGMLATPRAATVRGSIACYPPVWNIETPDADTDRVAALRTVVLTEAIATSLGAAALIYGDRTAALCDPYYPKHARLTTAEAATVLTWHRFGLRCRDLFLEGEDTSWYEIGDENGAVSVEAAVPVRPEPVGGGVFARVVQTDERIVVGVIDLTGSGSGRWSETTAAGSVTTVTVRTLVDHPERWIAEAAVLGEAGGRFMPLQARDVPHRQGRALEVELPLASGWSVLRLRRA